MIYYFPTDTCVLVVVILSLICIVAVVSVSKQTYDLQHAHEHMYFIVSDPQSYVMDRYDLLFHVTEQFIQTKASIIL
jgi:hypothetical protein